MNIRQLETFIAVVELKNFSKASEELFITQPTVSAHISSLEMELRTELIKRTTKEFSLTPAGEKLYVYAQNILELTKKAKDDLIGDRNKTLSIGTSSTIGIGELPDVLTRFYLLNPNITLEVINSDSLDIIKKVYENTLEIGLVGAISREYDLKYIPFTEDELVIVTPKTPYYEKLKGDSESVKKLLKEPLLMREDKSGTKREIERYFDEHKILTKNLNIIGFINDPVLILECIKRGLGVSILSQKVAKIFGKYDEFLVFPLENEKFLRKFYIVYTDEKYLTDLSKNFLGFLGKHYSIDLSIKL